MSEPILEKTCTRCDQTKPADLKHFPWQKKYNRLDSWCRECYRIQSRAWNATNPERKAATNKAYRESEGTQYKARRKARYDRRSLTQKERMKQHARAHNDRLKREAMERYGGAFCHCCGEDRLIMLALDHINNDGAAHRKSLTGKTRSMPTLSYIWAKRNNWPPIYKVSCSNCNWARHWNNGVCPHQIEREALWQSFLNHITAPPPIEADVLQSQAA